MTIKLDAFALCGVIGLSSCSEPPSPVAESNESAQAIFDTIRKDRRGRAVNPTKARSQDREFVGIQPAATTEKLFKKVIPVESDLQSAFNELGLPKYFNQLDRAIVGRIDLLPLISSGDTATIWVDQHRNLRAFDVSTKSLRLKGALWDGEFYDVKGHRYRGPLLGRPVAASVITSGFGMRFHPIKHTKKLHRGIDYGVPLGTQIHVVGDGRVLRMGFDKGGGNFVVVQHANGFESKYLHLQRFKAGLSRGTLVIQGDVIGYVGSTGASTGPHLHFELRKFDQLLDRNKTLPRSNFVLGPLDMSTFKKQYFFLFQ